MKAIKISLWESFDSEAKKISNANKDIIYDSTKEEEFNNIFQKYYDIILKNYMKKEVKNLDAHKQAAIGIVTFCLVKPFSIKSISVDEVFILNESLGLSVALSCMCDYLNKRLVKKKINKQIEEYIMPELINCDENFFFALCRNIYSEEECFYDEKVIEKFIINLSNTLFLLEYLTLKENNIEPSKLKE